MDDLILGVDPGLANTGWALLRDGRTIVDWGTIRTSPGDTAPRLVELVRALRDAIAPYPVREAALEELFMGKNATSGIAVAQARGAILAALGGAGVAVHEYTPAHVKAVLTGYGSAPKQQVMRMVAAQVQDPEAVRPDRPPISDHAGDAAAIAICHARSRRLRGLSRQSSGRTLADAARENPQGRRRVRPA
ncbi:MAG: crossover junction endodeoxyribonuclease RuvC [Candidatus Dormibacteraeota bacterium]|nr:crossover junction endodeoxyribonuclease RuvC [Candidatus Dormibacteraeota bacterium]MBO0745351.1 crossover junction endodeoxyribonuclease RuvC [Candidatus Dormibacteraeota bacterium]